jgi:DNA repair exonuclease SbcCD ATPase subunit
MTNLTDKEILTDLQKLEKLLERAWSNENIQEIHRQIEEARKQITELEPLATAINGADEKINDLQRICQNSNDLYSRLGSMDNRGRDCLDLLTTSMNESQSLIKNLNEKIADTTQQINTIEPLLEKIVREYNLLLEVKQNISEILKLIGGYKSISNLTNALAAATQRLQEEQDVSRKLLEEIKPIERKVDMLIQAQRAPWWWHSNWWWKKRINSNIHRLK